MKRLIRILLLALLIPFAGNGQITAPGQGGDIVLWTALGANQAVGERSSVSAAIACSAHNTPNERSVFAMPGIFHARTEFATRLGNRFKIGIGSSYNKKFYRDETHPHYLNEVRFYPKVSFSIGNSGWKFSQTFKTDFRFFSEPRFDGYGEPFEYRFRYQLKYARELGSFRHKLILINEFLAASDLQRKKGFTDLVFREDRLSVYYRYTFPNKRMLLDVGLMNQFWRKNTEDPFQHTILLQCDLIINNIFNN